MLQVVDSNTDIVDSLIAKGVKVVSNYLDAEPKNLAVNPGDPIFASLAWRD